MASFAAEPSPARRSSSGDSDAVFDAETAPAPAEAAHVREPPVRLGNATANGSCVVEILVVLRQDARSRAVRNHDQLLETVSARYPQMDMPPSPHPLEPGH